MKTSSMLIGIALLLIVGCLTAFNIELKKEYLTGNYKSKFKDMEFVALKGVAQLNIQDANVLIVDIEQGAKEGIWLRKSTMENIQYKANGQLLALGLSTSGKSAGYRSARTDVILVTHQLNKVNTHTDDGKNNLVEYGANNLRISGYNAKAFDLVLSPSVGIEMNTMTIGSLSAVIGGQAKGNASLQITGNTQINSASFNVPGASKLTLTDARITKTVYQLSDSATVTLNGKLMNMIR
jgi:hypothetical protein